MKRGFLDTNIVIYYYTLSEPRKREVAGSLMVANEELVVSTQVLSETCNVLRKKFGMEWSEIRAIIQELRHLFEVIRVQENTIDHAIEIAERMKVPYFDSLMLAAASEANCTVLYSEDFQNGQIIEGVTVINPFLEKS